MRHPEDVQPVRGDDEPAGDSSPLPADLAGLEATVGAVAASLAVEAAGVGTFDLDLTTSVLVPDERLLQLFGFDPDARGVGWEAYEARVHPQDLPATKAAMAAAVEGCGQYEASYRLLLPGGQVRWIAARGRVLCDQDGTAVRVLGAAYDTTDAHRGAERVAHVLESMAVGLIALDGEWRMTYVNAEAERITGSSRGQLEGASLWDAFPATVGTEFEVNYRRAVATGEPVSFDAFHPEPLRAWVQVRAVPEAGGLHLYFLDITARRTAQAAADHAADRAALLARVAAGLAEALDAEAALRGLLPLLVPALSEWCIATVVDPEVPGRGPRVRDVASWHADPARRVLTEDYRRLRGASLVFRDAVIRAMGLSEPVVIQSGAAASSAASLDAPTRALQAQLAPEAMVAVPLRGRGQVLGFLTFCNTAVRGSFPEADVATITEVAQQVGLALDNARLHAAARDLATELQRSLLTELPQPDHLQIAVRYVPAAAGVAVGGDWYDAFLTRDGSTCLVIGDVAGHDRDAAVAMAQARNLLRGIGYTLIEPPAAVLGMLDGALADLAVGALTTAILAKVEQGPDDAVRGLRTLRWSNAGHPPPLLVGRDAQAEFLTTAPDLLLGLGARSERHDHTYSLSPGSTVVLFTDGLVERRGEHLDEGLERLRATAERLARGTELDLESFCTALVEELAGGAEDDVAVMALRAHSEDLPRPAEAGPRRLPDDLLADRLEAR